MLMNTLGNDRNEILIIYIFRTLLLYKQINLKIIVQIERVRGNDNKICYIHLGNRSALRENVEARSSTPGKVTLKFATCNG